MHSQEHNCFLAFDFGQVRIGVAQGSRSPSLAHALQTITGKNKRDKFTQIEKLIAEWKPDALVVGLPTHPDGAEHEMTILARKFGQKLHQYFSLPVYWVDERFSSVYAENLLSEAGVFGKKRKEVLDQVAAQAILYAYLECGFLEKLPEN